jgi:uncharacterized protein
LFGQSAIITTIIGFVYLYSAMTIEQVKKIVTPILRKHGVTKAALFGSVANQTQSTDSDVDILVELNDTYSLLDFVGLKLDLEDALGKKVDLVEYQAIKPALKKHILNNPVSIYG